MAHPLSQALSQTISPVFGIPLILGLGLVTPALAQSWMGSPPPQILAELARVRIDGLENYQHSSNLYQLSIPQGWTENDLSEEDIVRTSFLDPLENALIVVAIVSNPTMRATPSALETVLKNDVESAFGDQDAFQMDKAVTMNDGSVNIPFNYTVNVNDLDEPMLGNGFIEKKGDYVSFIYVVIPADQFDQLKGDISTVINSFRLNEKARFPG
ncbi:MAG: hypothetical protein OHK0012_18450 [Synechococcales cyanobacterium]